MVGVPGRSKACHTCKQRRIRCNEEKPYCSNCIKSNRLCGGYVQKHAFILSQGMLALEPSPSEAILENAGPGALMATRWRIDPAKPSQKTMKQNIISLIHQRQCRSSCLPSQISLHHAGRQQILNIFLADHLPSEVLKDRSPVTRQRYWLLQIQDAPVLSPALESAILAICIAKLGRKYNDRALVCEGLLMYTKGLRQLRQALRNAKSRGEDETLAACLALIMFESAHCPNQSTESILAHYQGAMNLLKLRGPEAYTTGLAHCMLQILRIQSVFCGMLRRSKTFLADRKWCDLPWKSSQKGLQDLLTDILLKMPEIYHRNDELSRESCQSKMLTGLISVVELCWQVDSQLKDWYSRFEISVAGPIYCPKLSTSNSPVDDAESGKVFAVAFHFPSFDVATTMVSYWLALLLVHPILCSFYERLVSLVGVVQENVECSCIEDAVFEPTDATSVTSAICRRHFSISKLPPLGYRTGWAPGAARNICQSVEYIMQEEMGELGASIILPRLMTVREFLVFAPGDWSRELSWIANQLKKIQDMGNDVSRYV